MKVRLFHPTNSFWSYPNYLIDFKQLSFTEYWVKRLQFWKYRKKRTMGRPVLMYWKEQP